MKLINLTFIIFVFLDSCGQRVEQNKLSNISANSTEISNNSEEEYLEPDTKELRKKYISNYSKIEIIDTTFTDDEGERIHVQTKYYCLYDNAIVVPKQYVWEDTTKSFTTHNYSHDILILIDKDTIFNKTITKADFADKLFPELTKYAVLMLPNFKYDKQKKVFAFGYSL